MAAGDVDEKSTIRCIDVARYALAFAVTVVIVTVTAYAIVVVLRPEPLILSVVGGFVSVERNQSSQTPRNGDLNFFFNLRASNPSGRVRIYYTNIAVYLCGKNASTSPATVQEFVGFDLLDIAVRQQSIVDSNSQFPGLMDYDQSQKPYYDMLYNNSTIPDAAMLLNGTLTVELYSERNMTGRPAIYYCSPLTVGGDSSPESAAGDAPCTDKATFTC